MMRELKEETNIDLLLAREKSEQNQNSINPAIDKIGEKQCQQE